MAAVDAEKSPDTYLPTSSPSPSSITKTISFSALPSKTTTNPSSSSLKSSTSTSQPRISKSASIPRPIDPSLPTPTSDSKPRQKFPASPYPFPQAPRGYPLLATTMATTPSLRIFRRFINLNYLALLSLQAELQELEKEYLAQVQSDDMSADPVRAEMSTNWHTMPSAEQTSAPQRELLRQIREKLHEYNTLLSSVSATQRLVAPNARNIRDLKSWLNKTKLGGTLKPSESGSCDNFDGKVDAELDWKTAVGPWDPRFESDLIILETPARTSFFSRMARVMRLGM